jgi:hypothetical protein
VIYESEILNWIMERKRLPVEKIEDSCMISMKSTVQCRGQFYEFKKIPEKKKTPIQKKLDISLQN